MARTVLLADDSVTAQNMGRRILMDAGYEVITVNNGSAALKKIHENRPDLIVLDVYMPGYGGLEVCQRLKESGETMQIPVLLTVGKMEPFKADEAKKVRADGHIVKPFEASELLAALTRLEDRIVPQATAPRGRNGRSTEKKARFWYAEDPVANFADLPSDKVAYLADVRKRQTESPVAERATSDESTPPVVAEIPVEPASAAAAEMASMSEAAPVFSAPEVALPETSIAPQTASSQDQRTSEVEVGEPAAEFTVTAEAPAIEESESRVEVAKIEIAPIETDTIDAKTEEMPPAIPAPEAAAVTGQATTTGAASGVAHWVAENVPLTAAEALIDLDQEMQQAQAASPEVASSGPETPAREQGASSEVPKDSSHLSLPVLEQQDENQIAPGAAETTNTSGAAFAAAASMSPAVSTQHLAPSVQPLHSPAENAIPDQDAESPAPSEAAAAWENWRQIRESVMNGEKTAAIAEAAAEIFQSTASAQEHQPSAELSSVSPSPSTPAIEDSSLSSIVDSVLAELKPKLMEEIAKKLSAEKK